FARGRARPVLLDGHNGVRLHSALHDEGARRTDLWAHGGYLCLCPWRGAAPGTHPLARAVHLVFPQAETGAGQPPRPLAPTRLSAAARTLPQVSRGDTEHLRGADGGDGALRGAPSGT